MMTANANKIRRYKAFTIGELVVAIAVLGLLLGGLGFVMGGFSLLNELHMTRQRCVAAGQAQLNSFSATGEKIDEKLFKELWPRVNVEIEQSDGTGDWEGLKLIEVTMTAKVRRKKAEVRLSRYLTIDKDE